MRHGRGIQAAAHPDGKDIVVGQGRGLKAAGNPFGETDWPAGDGLAPALRPGVHPCTAPASRGQGRGIHAAPSSDELYSELKTGSAGTMSKRRRECAWRSAASVVAGSAARAKMKPR